MAAPDRTGNGTGGPRGPEARTTQEPDRERRTEPNRAGPARQEDRHGNRTAPDRERSQPEDRTGSTAETARADGLQRWTKAGDGHHQHQGQDRTGARADGGAVAGRIETAIENRRAKLRQTGGRDRPPAAPEGFYARGIVS